MHNYLAKLEIYNNLPFDLIFKGGLINHRNKDKLCRISFYYETDKNFCHVEFENGDTEICHLKNLIKYVDNINAMH